MCTVPVLKFLPFSLDNSFFFFLVVIFFCFFLTGSYYYSLQKSSFLNIIFCASLLTEKEIFFSKRTYPMHIKVTSIFWLCYFLIHTFDPISNLALYCFVVKLFALAYNTQHTSCKHIVVKSFFIIFTYLWYFEYLI